MLGFAYATAFFTTYKWLDDEGNTHYTQQPSSAGIESKTIKPPRAVDSSEAEKELEKQLKYIDTGIGHRQK